MVVNLSESSRKLYVLGRMVQLPKISTIYAGTYNVTVTGVMAALHDITTIINDNTSFTITGITTDNTSCLTPNGSISLTSHQWQLHLLLVEWCIIRRYQ
ncbi:MAG: hypothetical protein IPL08_11565 [Saprospiraceae bacterium]|nr:hypothetical protein [Saprospiraceae bacterium]